jgi:hypothetical protein
MTLTFGKGVVMKLVREHEALHEMVVVCTAVSSVVSTCSHITRLYMQQPRIYLLNYREIFYHHDNASICRCITDD